MMDPYASLTDSASGPQKKQSEDPLGDAGLAVPGSTNTGAPTPPPPPPSMASQAGAASTPPVLTPPPSTITAAAPGDGNSQAGANGPPVTTPAAPANPLSTMSEAEKTAYWAGQGVQGLANVGYTPKLVTATGSAYVDPEASGAATDAYKTANAGLINDVTGRVQSGQAAQLAAANANSASINQGINQTNAATMADAVKAAGGVFRDEIPAGTTYSPEMMKNLPTRAEWLAANGGAPPTAQAPVAGAGTAPGDGASQAGANATPGGAPSPDLSVIQNALASLLKQQGDTQAATARSRDQQIQDLMSEYATPGRQTTADNSNPLSAVTSIDPENDLRSAVITDTPDARTAGYASRVDQAASAMPTDRVGMAKTLTDGYLKQLGNTDVQAGAGVGTQASDRLSQIRKMVDEAMGGLSSVDRFKLAGDKFNTYSQSTDPAYELSLKKALDRATASGGSKSGMLRTEYGNLDLARARDLDVQKQQLFQQALADSVNDSLNKSKALSGYEDQLTGAEAAQRGEQRAERQYTTDVSTGNVNRRLEATTNAQDRGEKGASDTFNDAETNLNNLRGLESTSRAANDKSIGDLRGERDFQVGQEKSAFDRALQQYLTEQGTKQQQFQNGLSLLNTGSQGNPASTLMTGAGQINPAAAMQAIAQLAAAQGRGAAQGGNGSTTLPNVPGVDVQKILSTLQNSGIDLSKIDLGNFGDNALGDFFAQNPISANGK